MKNNDSQSPSRLPDELIILPDLSDEDHIQRWINAREALYDLIIAIDDKTIMKTSDGYHLVAFSNEDIDMLNRAIEGFEFYKV